MIEFETDIQNGIAPLTVNFYSGASCFNGATYEFGDGDFAIIDNSTTIFEHTYSEPGTYYVTVISYESNIEQKATFPIVIDGATHLPEDIVFDFSWSPDINYPNTPIQFTSNIEGEYDSLEWLFGNYTTSTNPNPLATYRYYGYYPMTLTVKRGTASKTKMKVIKITNSDTRPPELVMLFADELCIEV